MKSDVYFFKRSLLNSEVIKFKEDYDAKLSFSEIFLKSSFKSHLILVPNFS